MNKRTSSDNICWEVDGLSIRLTENEDSKVKRSGQSLKILMERNTESRIRTIQRVNNKLWVTLYHNLSEFKAPLCRVLNDYVANLKKYFDSVVIDQIDLKIDSFGSFQVYDLERAQSLFKASLEKGVERISLMERGFAPSTEYVFDCDGEEKLKVMPGGQDNTVTFLNACIFYERTPWHGNKRKQKHLKKVPLFNVKRYDKRTELIQKATVGQSIGSRIGNLVGYGVFEENKDPTFQARIKQSMREGLVRDEVSVYKASGQLEKLDGRILDLEESERLIKNVVGTLDKIRKPTLRTKVLKESVWSIHQDFTLSLFAHLPLNQVIIGERRLAILYAKHQFNCYTTG